MTSRTCPKCRNVRETAEVICPVCGETLQSVARIKATGVFLVVVGFALLGFMICLSVWMANVILDKTGATYRGGANDTAFIVFAFGLVMLISLNAVAAGIWQIVFGRRNKALVMTMAILGIGFAAAGFALVSSK